MRDSTFCRSYSSPMGVLVKEGRTVKKGSRSMADWSGPCTCFHRCVFIVSGATSEATGARRCAEPLLAECYSASRR